MTNQDYMRTFVRRAAALVALLWAVQVINWITTYGLNPTFRLIPRYLCGLDGVIAMLFLHGSFAHLIALEQSEGNTGAAVMFEIIGQPITQNEMAWIVEIREASGDTDPRLTSRSAAAVRGSSGNEGA